MPKENTDEPKLQIAPRKSSLNTTRSNEGWRPEQLDPDLANMAMANLLVEKMGTPSRINQVFNARKAMLMALNHREPVYDELTGVTTDAGNPTGYDCSMRIAAYEKWERGSINVDGWYGEKIWAFLMKPKLMITSLAGQGAIQEEEPKESMFSGLWKRISGGGKNDTTKSP